MTDLLQKLGEAAGRSSPGAYGRWGAWFSGSLAYISSSGAEKSVISILSATLPALLEFNHYYITI